MSKSSSRRSSKDRFEARYNSMKIAQKGQGDIYNVMLDRLSKAIENGELSMDDSSRTHAEQAHILLQKAASQLISKQQQQQQQQQRKGKNKSSSKSSSSSSSSSKPLQGGSKSERRQLAAKWAKENPTGAPSPDMISPNKSQQLTHTPDYSRRRYDPDNESSDEEEEEEEDDDGRRGSDSDSEEEEDEESSSQYDSDDSETGQEIHNTRKLLKGAANRLHKGRDNLLLDEGVNNTIYNQLMKELNIGEKKQDGPMRRSELRAQAAAGVRPTLERGPDQVSRRAYAADVLTADKTTREQQNLPGMLRANTTPSERRTHALDILKNIQQQRRSSNPDVTNRLHQSAKSVLQSPAHSTRSGGSSIPVSSPVPSLTGSQQSHGSGDSISRSSTSGRNHQQHRRRSLEYSSRHGHAGSKSGRSGRRKSHDGAKLESFLASES